MLAGQDLEQGFFLRRIEHQTQRPHVAEELLQDVVRVHRSGWRGQQRGLARVGNGHGFFGAAAGRGPGSSATVSARSTARS